MNKVAPSDVPRFLSKEEAHGAHLTLAAKGIKDHYRYVSEVVRRPITSLTEITTEEAERLWRGLSHVLVE